MAIVNPQRQVLTVIFEFEVEPEEQRALSEGIQWLARELVSKQPGFVSSNLHLSQDGRKVLNYLQWESREAYEALGRDEEKQALVRSVVGRYSPQPRVYDIVFAAEASSDSSGEASFLTAP